MITPNQLDELKTHLQTAIDVELSTIPIYLYTYYSINRQPSLPTKLDDSPRGDAIATFANKAGGILMSVAVEEMLHLSLVSNILKSLGGSPKIYGQSPAHYPTNLDHHKKGFSIGLSKLTANQLNEFLAVEKPAPPKPNPEPDQWETLGQFYQYIASLIKLTEKKDYLNPDYQLAADKGFYASNNVDTVYPKSAFYIKKPENPKDPAARGADAAQYSNSEDSGNLKKITCKEDALKAIMTISEQGEGYPLDPKHEYDDRDKSEKSHWYKYAGLLKEFNKLTLKPDELALIVHPLPTSKRTKDFPPQFQPIVNLSNAVYSYLLLMTEMSFTLQGTAQSEMFYIGMHKGMIFILDKIIGGMRYLTFTNSAGKTRSVAPSFENYTFSSIKTAKSELVKLCETVAADPKLNLDANILARINDLPDVNVVNNKVSFA
jgi:Ferritin-like